MASTKLFIKLDKESYDETLKQLLEMKQHTYVFAKMLKRSWLLRLIFGVNLKKLEMEFKHD